MGDFRPEESSIKDYDVSHV